MVVTPQRLSREGFDLPPLAPAVGPFAGYDFLSAWWEELGPAGEILTVADERGLLALHKLDASVAFLGDDDHTDYHSPLGHGIEVLLGRLVHDLGPGLHLNFDSMPVEACQPITAGLVGAGLRPEVGEHTVAMVLELPANMNDFMDALDKKDRHELRRKRRRYIENVGSIVHTTHEGRSSGFDEFVRLHRLSPGAKGSFISGKRHAFFSRLASQPGWRVDLLENHGVATAGLFGWTDGQDYYLYNSSFDPSLQSSSPGLVLLVAMIEHAIASGFRRFDFLKGNEPYKARMGAHPRQLYRVDAHT